MSSDNDRLKPLGEFLRPFRVSRNSALTIPDGGCDDPISGNKVRIEPAGNSKADDARNARVNRSVQGGGKTRALAANH